MYDMVYLFQLEAFKIQNLQRMCMFIPVRVITCMYSLVIRNQNWVSEIAVEEITEDGGDTCLRNIGKHLQGYTASKSVFMVQFNAKE
jgi:hypothetical protein